MKTLWSRKRLGHPRTDAIVEFLAMEFDHDEETSTVMRNALERMDGQVPPTLEIIVDEPAAANWRVKADPRQGRWALRISYYGFSQSEQALNREELLCQSLLYLSAP